LQSSAPCLGCAIDCASCLVFVFVVCCFCVCGSCFCSFVCCFVSVACICSVCAFGGSPLVRSRGCVGAPVLHHPDCLVWSFPTTLSGNPYPIFIHTPNLLIFTCYIARYLCAGQEVGRASQFFLPLTHTRCVLYYTVLPPPDPH